MNKIKITMVIALAVHLISLSTYISGHLLGVALAEELIPEVVTISHTDKLQK